MMLLFIPFHRMAGMVPALYAQDERDALCNTIRHEVRTLTFCLTLITPMLHPFLHLQISTCKVRHAGIPETPENMWTYYVNKCRSNLHIVFAMSPSGSKLRIRCRYTNCHHVVSYLSNCMCFYYSSVIHHYLYTFINSFIYSFVWYLIYTVLHLLSIILSNTISPSFFSSSLQLLGISLV